MRNFADVIERCRQDDAAKFDTNAMLSPSTMEFINPNITPADALIAAGDTVIENGEALLRVHNGTTRDASLTKWSRQQVLNRLGIPAQYWDRCPADLKATNGNFWLANQFDKDSQRIVPREESEVLLRYRDRGDGRNDLRAMLSTRYAKVNNADLSEAMYDVAKQSDYRMEVSPYDHVAITDTHFFARVLFPDLMKEVRPGDWMQVGVIIGNSEVGARRITMQAFLWRLICDNGMIGDITKFDGFQHRHVGMNRPELISNINFSLANALEGGAEMMALQERAMAVSFEEPENKIRELLDKGGWGSLADRAVEHWEAGDNGQFARDNTALGVTNAITRAAQILTPEQRVEVEEFATDAEFKLVTSA